MKTYEDVASELAKIVAEVGPDFVYRGDSEEGGVLRGEGLDPFPWISCFYTKRTPEGDLVPSCIVGQWLHRYLEVPLAELRVNEGASVTALALEDRVEDDAILFLNHVQSEQDDGKPWGEALEIALSIDRAILGC